MKMLWPRCGSMILLFLVMLLMPACSSQQQEQEELENSQDQEQGEEGQEYSEQNQGEEEQLQQGEQGEGNEFTENPEGGLDGQGGNGDQFANGGNEGGDDDLANIINEMNQQSMDGQGEDLVQQGGESGELTQDASLNQEAPSPGHQGGGGAIDGGDFNAGAAGLAAGPSLPELGSKLTYVVRSGDTLGKISRRIYGTVLRWRKLAKLSGIADPSRIYPGDIVYYQLTQKSLSFATEYENRSRSEITAEEGDTLKSIASKVYGSAKNWKHIWRQNAHVMDPENISAGTDIYYVSGDAMSSLSETIKVEKLAFNEITFDNISVSELEIELLEDEIEIVDTENLVLDLTAELLDV